MTHVDIVILSSYIAFATIAIAVIACIVRISVGQRPHDPEGVRRLVEETARKRQERGTR